MAMVEMTMVVMVVVLMTVMVMVTMTTKARVMDTRSFDDIGTLQDESLQRFPLVVELQAEHT